MDSVSTTPALGLLWTQQIQLAAIGAAPYTIPKASQGLICLDPQGTNHLAFEAAFRGGVARIQLILACVGPHLLNEDTAASLVETVRNCSHQRRAGQNPDIRGVIMYLFVLDVVGRRPALVPRFPEWWSRALAIVDQFKTLYAQVQRQVAKEMIKLAVMVLPQANTAVAIEKNAGEQQIEMAAEVKQEQTAHDMIASSLAIQRLTEEYANAGSAGRKGAGRLRQNW